MTIYYVYFYLREKDSVVAKKGTPYYVGKGKGNRAYVPHHTVGVPQKINIIKVHENLSEIEAFYLERYYIRWFGRIDNKTGILRNLTDGGEGTCGHIASADSKLMRKKTVYEKYGVEYISQYPSIMADIQIKMQNTCLEKYGVPNAMQNPKIREKSKRTNLEKYGYEELFQSPEIREKVKRTCLEKYGTESSNQSSEVKEKKRKTSLSRFGVSHHLQSPEVQKIRSDNSLKKHGVSHPSKIKKSCIHCGELKSITHPGNCKLNPNKKHRNQTGENNPSVKTYLITRPDGHVEIIKMRANLIKFAQENNVNFDKLYRNQLEGWQIQIEYSSKKD
jgi:hypothetical protein